MNIKEAIKVLKDAKYIGSDEYASDYDKRMNEAIDTVVSEVEKSMFTAEDTESFAEWCSKNKWYAFGQEEHMWYNYTKQITKTTTQLRELWEKERKEATEL